MSCSFVRSSVRSLASLECMFYLYHILIKNDQKYFSNLIISEPKISLTLPQQKLSKPLCDVDSLHRFGKKIRPIYCLIISITVFLPISLNKREPNFQKLYKNTSELSLGLITPLLNLIIFKCRFSGGEFNEKDQVHEFK